MAVLDAGGDDVGSGGSGGGGGPVSRTDGIEWTDGTKPDTAVTLDATVSNAEFLGDSTRTYLRWNGRELTIRSADPVSGKVRVGFDGGDAHVIDVRSKRE
jgi:thiamine transport system ATP-binding protein